MLFVLRILLTWLIVPTQILLDFYKARNEKKRLKVVFISLFIWSVLMSAASIKLYFLKSHSPLRFLPLILVAWTWKYIFRFAINRYAPFAKAENFYRSRAWRELRYEVLRDRGRKCELCRSEDGPMHVDHIRPRSKYPRLALSVDNLQVLCEACNLGKGVRHEDDFRKVA